MTAVRNDSRKPLQSSGVGVLSLSTNNGSRMKLAYLLEVGARQSRSPLGQLIPKDTWRNVVARQCAEAFRLD
jgi:hypothetical protein